MTTTTLNLVKGQKIDLTKTNPGLTIAHVGLGWDTNKAAGAAAFDLDAFAFIAKDGKLVPSVNDHIIFFGHLKGHGLEHLGDNLTGVGDGDDETIKITLGEVEPECNEIFICVNIYQAVERKQNFGMVQNAFIRVYDGVTGTELTKFDLSEDYSQFNSMVMGKLYKKDNEWKFQALGNGINGDINEVAATFL